MDAGSPPTEAAAYATMVRSDASGSGAGRRSGWWTLPSDVLHESVRRILTGSNLSMPPTPWTTARSREEWDQFRPFRETHGPAEVRRPGLA